MTKDFLAQANHFLFSWGVIMGRIALKGPVNLWTVVGIWTVYTLWKEFWFDIHHEPPEDSGGWRGGLIDFSYYSLGTGMALGMYFLRHV